MTAGFLRLRTATSLDVAASLLYQRLINDNPFSCTPGGIGNSLAREFHARGLRVFATARSKDSIEDLSEEFGIECLSLEVDSPESVEACFEEVKALVGNQGLNYLVNNAGRSKSLLPVPAWPGAT